MVELSIGMQLSGRGGDIQGGAYFGAIFEVTAGRACRIGTPHD
jgi:hypothetical protein